MTHFRLNQAGLAGKSGVSSNACANRACPGARTRVRTCTRTHAREDHKPVTRRCEVRVRNRFFRHENRVFRLFAPHRRPVQRRFPVFCRLFCLASAWIPPDPARPVWRQSLRIRPGLPGTPDLSRRKAPLPGFCPGLQPRVFPRLPARHRPGTTPALRFRPSARPLRRAPRLRHRRLPRPSTP